MSKNWQCKLRWHAWEKEPVSCETCGHVDHFLATCKRCGQVEKHFIQFGYEAMGMVYEIVEEGE